MEQTLDRCHCGDPLFEKVGANGTTTYFACHHCDRGCTTDPKVCPRCIASGAYDPYETGEE
jgi:primosomal protein N'